ncbi:MAG: M23 family metallopeptidase [Candidatus Helarchaeota archaeon]
MNKKFIILIAIIVVITTFGIIILIENYKSQYPDTLSPGKDPILCLPLYDFSHCDAIAGFGQVSPDYYHNGIDFGVNDTTAIVAPHAAYIEMIQFWFNEKGGHWQTNIRLWLNSQWTLEIIFESWALNETYGQMQRDAILVSKGQYVEANQTLGSLLVHGPGAHIHFSVYSNDVGQCPYNYFSPSAKATFEAHFYLVNCTQYWCM